LDLLKVKEG